MKRLSFNIHPDPTGQLRLAQLQSRFAEACNHVAAYAIENNAFNRVTLHHLAYRSAREQFADLGSQLISNAIYAVCRKAKTVSNPSLFPRFPADAPVYFDRHTLSLNQGRLSMYTLEGRIKFECAVREELQSFMRSHPLKEALLERAADSNGFQLTFYFKQEDSTQSA